MRKIGIYICHSAAFLYLVITFFMNVFFGMYRNYAPENPEDYQSGIDFIIAELQAGNPNAYIIMWFDIIAVIIVAYYVYLLICVLKEAKQERMEIKRRNSEGH